MDSDTPYPGPTDTRYATEEAARFFTAFFTAKTERRIDTTHACFHPDTTYYADATLGWAFPSNEALRGCGSSTCRSGARKRSPTRCKCWATPAVPPWS
ncbi:hypothetical protein GCM10020295_80140 [Streptomyces cinereospinus]